MAQKVQVRITSNHATPLELAEIQVDRDHVIISEQGQGEYSAAQNTSQQHVTLTKAK